MNTFAENQLPSRTAPINSLGPTLGFYALEARRDFEKRDPWFFLHQSSLACEHLTDVQHFQVEFVEYAGVHNGWHVWLAHH